MVRIWKPCASRNPSTSRTPIFADLGFVLDRSGRRLIVISCLDNLGKGRRGPSRSKFQPIF